MISSSPGAISIRRFVDGKFPLLQQLGGTEWSAAYLTELGEPRAQKAAIKIFSFDSVDAGVTMARWEMARTLSHPHLMPLIHAGRCEFEGEDLFYVVTEYANELLSQILPERPLSPEEAREMLVPVLGALSYLHERSLTHGHLRPTNIMVVNDQLKLSPDFGWRSRTRNIYDPPEAGLGNPAPTSDIWSLGVLLVEALTQQLPVLDRWQGGEPEIPAAVPEPFFTICRECLRVDPERRCTLAGIKARLKLPRAAERAVEAAEAIVHQAAKPSYRFRVMILSGVAIFLFLLLAAFKIGWDLTPWYSAPADLSLRSRRPPRHRRLLRQPLPHHPQRPLPSRRRHQHQYRYLYPRRARHRAVSSRDRLCTKLFPTSQARSLTPFMATLKWESVSRSTLTAMSPRLPSTRQAQAAISPIRPCTQRRTGTSCPHRLTAALPPARGSCSFSLTHRKLRSRKLRKPRRPESSAGLSSVLGRIRAVGGCVFPHLKLRACGVIAVSSCNQSGLLCRLRSGRACATQSKPAV